MLRYRRESERDRAALVLGALVLTKTGRLELEDNIFRYYRSINQYDIFGLQSYRIRGKYAK